MGWRAFEASLYLNIDGNVVINKYSATCVSDRGETIRLSLLNLNGHTFLEKSVASTPVAEKRSGSATGVLIKIASSGEIQGWLDEQRGSDCRLRFDEDCPQLNEEEAQAAAEAILADLNDVVNREAQEEEPRTSLERVLGSKVLGIVQPTLAVRS
jgi:hypothetical protein